MDALGLYKFINDNRLEWHKTNDGYDVILFVNIYEIEDWNKLLGSGIMDEEGISCTMKEGYFCFMMKDICEYFDIETDKVFAEE